MCCCRCWIFICKTHSTCSFLELQKHMQESEETNVEKVSFGVCVLSTVGWEDVRFGSWRRSFWSKGSKGCGGAGHEETK